MELFEKMKRMREMQGEMKKIQDALGQDVVSGKSQYGAVVVEMTAAMEIKKVTIAPETVARQDTALLERLVTEAFAAALKRAQKAAAASMSQMPGGLGGLSQLLEK